MRRIVESLSAPVMMSDGMTVGAFALGVIAWLTGQALTPATLFAMGTGMLIVSIGWRIGVRLHSRWYLSKWPFDPDRPIWRRRTRT